MKKIIALFLLCGILLLSFIACENNANENNENETIKNGNDTNGDSSDVGSTDNKDATETLKETPASDFEYTVSSSGKSVFITKHIGNSEEVVIPSEIEDLPVIQIKSGAFENSIVKNVVLPKTVTGIGGAFKNCTSLSSVTIPQDSELYIIGQSAFENCTSLKTINLEVAEKLTTIEGKAFRNCSSIEEIILPKNLKDVYAEAFSNCSSLKSVTISSELKYAGGIGVPLGVPFYDNPAIEKIIFTDGIQTINAYANFGITSEAEIIIPKSVKTFESDTFFIYAPTKFTFLGDCPENELTLFAGEHPIIICYNPNTDGWDTCVWKDKYTFVPME